MAFRRCAPVALLTVLSSATVVAQTTLPANPGIEWRPTASALTAACDSSLAIGRAMIERFHARPAAQRTFANSMVFLERENARMSRTAGAGALLLYISPDSAVRAASQGCSQRLSDFGIELASDAEIYRTAAALRRAGAARTPADRKLLDDYIEAGRHAGAALDSVTRARTTRLQRRISDLERDFSVALAADTSRIHISADETSGISPQLLGTLKPDSSGGYVIPVNEGTFILFLRTAASDSARKRFADTYEARGGAANVRRLEQALAARDTLAHLFGFRNWAAYQLDTHMAKEPGRVIDFLDRIDVNLVAATRNEIAELASLKRSTGDTGAFIDSDISYYSAMLRRTKYNLDPEEIRQYFPVDHVLPAVLAIYEQLLGVHFTEFAQPDIWVPGVREFEVTDAKTRRALGWIYFDLYPRPNKFEHFATAPARTGVYWTSGSPDLPVTMIVGNWPTPQPGKPSLLSHGDVITFFHEFGHMMAASLVRAPYPSLTGLRQDFLEAPSQMLENWMWQPEILARVSKNVTTGKPLPKELIDRMVALRRLGAGLNNSQQAFFAMYDMRLHTTPGLETKATWDSLYTRMVGQPVLTGAYPAAGFGHIMSGYDAGYYGYLWSKVYAQDLFTRFESAGVMSPEAGRAYRTMILEPGGAREPDELLRAFLGRPLSDEAFYRDLGIASQKLAPSSRVSP